MGWVDTSAGDLLREAVRRTAHPFGGPHPALAAERAGCPIEGGLRQGLVGDGVRQDCWTGSVPRGEVPG